MRYFRLAALGVLAALIVASIVARPNWMWMKPSSEPRVDDGLRLIRHPKTAADKIVNGAKMEAIRKVRYDASYLTIPYPNGDVPKDQGACTDVIVRALRNAGYDLQKLMHEDMAGHFSLYPQQWHMSGPDSNIDHRRVPNHIAFMKRFAKQLPLSTGGEDAKTWQPGDLVYWTLTPTNLTHCGVISNDRNADGLPLVIHNIGPVTRQADCLTSWRIIGHFRYPR
jgi:uncharacterized protein YijF (DUF1287 family)